VLAGLSFLLVGRGRWLLVSGANPEKSAVGGGLREMMLDAALARKPSARDARVGVLSKMGLEMLGWDLRGRVAEEGAAVLPEVVGMLDEWVTGSE